MESLCAMEFLEWTVFPALTMWVPGCLASFYICMVCGSHRAASVVWATHAVWREMMNKDEVAEPRSGSSAVLVCALVACFPLAVVLPQFLSWENGLLEQLQNVTLAIGLVVAVWSARWLAQRPAAYAMWIAAFFWMGFLGRELSWAGVFMPPSSMTPWGPAYWGYDLWWKPYVRAGLLVLAAVGMYWFLRHKLWSQVLVRLWREQALPIGPVLVFGAAMLVTINAEGHGWLRLPDWYGPQSGVLEELVETVGYIALYWAQWVVVRHLGRCRMAEKLQAQLQAQLQAS